MRKTIFGKAVDPCKVQYADFVDCYEIGTTKGDNMTKEEALRKIDELKQYVEELDSPKTYRIGMKFQEDGDTYILAAVEDRRVGLINVAFGTRWGEPVRVESLYKITEAEFRKFRTGSSFKPIS